MNIQQYYEEKEQKEKEKAEQQNPTTQPSDLRAVHDTSVIPVVEEQASIDTVVAETAKINIHKTVTEVNQIVNVPLVQEGYQIERVPVNAIVTAMPPMREEGDTVIIPVVREVLVVEKRLELVEEVRITKHRTTLHHEENIVLKKEEVHIHRTPADHHNK